MLICLLLSVLCIVAGFVFDGLSKPNGDLGLYYAVDTCLSKPQSFDVAGRSYVDVFLMRAAPAAGEQPGTACPAQPEVSPTTTITLEADDGYRAGAPYSPVFVLPDSAYAMAAISVEDAKGNVLLPNRVLSMGPDEYYPWAVEASAISYPTTSPPSAAPPGTSATTSSTTTPGTACSGTCVDSCGYASDGTCDDGGPGSKYGVCDYGFDCSDCGCRASGTSGRRLLYASAGLGGGDDDDDFNDELEMPSAPLAAAAGGASSPVGGRRLLKGGSSSSGRSSSGSSYGSSSRSSYTGVSSGSSRSSFTSTATRTSYSSSYRTSSRVSPAVYGSRSYGGHTNYYVGNRYYYMGGSPYSYSYGRHWYYTGAAFFIVSRYSYGCYSCYGSYRTCYSCSGCNNRRDCSGGRSENTLASLFDRYEIDINFDLPAAGSDAWPLTLKVDNFTIFAPRKTASATPTQAANGYLTFVTSAGDTFESIGGFLSPVGWIATVFLSIIFVCKSRQLFPPSEARRFEAHRPSALAFASAHGGVQLASAPMQPVSYGQQVYAQPMQPVAVAQPVGCQPVAMAVAQPMAYPGQGGVVYPQQGYPGQGGGVPMATYVQRQ